MRAIDVSDATTTRSIRGASCERIKLATGLAPSSIGYTPHPFHIHPTVMYASAAFRTTTKNVPPAARRVAGRKMFRRFQTTSSSSSPPPSYGTPHVAAGVAGGAVVLLGGTQRQFSTRIYPDLIHANKGYAWYHISGAKKAVDASRTAAAYYQQTKDAIASKAPKNPNEALDQLRHFAHSYLVIIPGARPHVDAAFDTIDELRDSHGDDVNRIVSDGYEEIRTIIRDSSSLDATAALKVFDVFRRRTAELEELGEGIGKDVFGSLSEKYPQLSEKLGGGYDEFQKLVKTHGPEAKKIYNETTQQVRVLCLERHHKQLTEVNSDQRHLLQGFLPGQHRPSQKFVKREDGGTTQIRPIVLQRHVGSRPEGCVALPRQGPRNQGIPERECR